MKDAPDGGEESREDEEENSDSERLRLRTIVICLEYFHLTKWWYYVRDGRM